MKNPLIHRVYTCLTSMVSIYDEEKREFNSDNAGEIEFAVDDEGLFTFVSTQIQADDLDSEPDNFMNVLNNTESESEIDTDFQTKHEVERSFNLNNDRAIDEVHDQMPLHADDITSNETKQEVNQYCNIDHDITKAGICEFVVDKSSIQSRNLRSSAADNGSYEEPSFDNVLSSQFRVPEELPKSAEEPCKVDIAINNSIVESLNTESLCNPSDAKEVPQQNLLSNEDQNALDGCQTNPKDNSCVQPVQFWTNGCLSGLQSLKPPVFVAPNTISEGSSANDKVVVNVGEMGERNELAQSSEITGRNSSKCSLSYQEISNAISNKKTSWRFLSAVFDTKREKNGYFQLCKSFNNNLVEERIGCQRMSKKIPLMVELYIVKLVKVTCHHSNRIPLNDFQRSLIHSQGLGYRALNDKTFKGYKGNGFFMHSPSSSPPFQHMEISFQPANDGDFKAKIEISRWELWL